MLFQIYLFNELLWHAYLADTLGFETMIHCCIQSGYLQQAHNAAHIGHLVGVHEVLPKGPWTHWPPKEFAPGPQPVPHRKLTTLTGLIFIYHIHWPLKGGDYCFICFTTYHISIELASRHKEVDQACANFLFTINKANSISMKPV